MNGELRKKHHLLIKCIKLYNTEWRSVIVVSKHDLHAKGQEFESQFTPGMFFKNICYMRTNIYKCDNLIE